MGLGELMSPGGDFRLEPLALADLVQALEALFAKAGLKLTRVLPTAHPAVEIIEVVAASE